MAGKKFCIGFALAAAAWSPVAFAAADTLKPVELKDMLTLETAGGSQLSPDGTMVAYRRTKVDTKADRYDSDLWIMRSDGSGARLLSDAWSPAWLPNGRLSYLTDGDKGPRLIIRSVSALATSDGPEMPVDVEGPSLSNVNWSPDGSQFAYVGAAPRTDDPWPVKLPPAAEGGKWGPAPAVVSTIQYRVGVDQYRTSDRHIFVVPASGGKARQITSGPWQVGAYYSGINFGTTVEWTRDGSALLFDGLARGEDSIMAAQSSQINRVDLATGTISVLTPQAGFWRMPRVSPDGKFIAYTGNRSTGAAFEAQELRVMNRDGSGDRVLLAEMPDRLSQYSWSPDGKALLLSMNHKGATELWRVGFDGKVSVLASGRYRFYVSSVSKQAAFGSLMSHHRDSEIASVDLASGKLKRLTNHNGASERLALASSTEIWTKSADGTPVQGWLFRPATFDATKRYPLILDIHGGPDAMAGYDFDFRYHDFAARGYLVATSNPGGSTGYGTQFADRIRGGFPGTKDREDLEAFLDRVIAEGSVDPARIYVMGCSGGGSLAAWLAARTQRFAAAAVMCPLTNWVSFAGTTDATTWAFTRFSKPYWEDPEGWAAHSPLTYAKHINIPVLFANGGRDQRTPTSQAAELYTALRMRGIPTRLLVFSNEGHGPWRSVPSNLLRLQLYVDEWFNTLGHPDDAPSSLNPPG